MEHGKNIVILGGGYGGIEAAKQFHKKYKKNKEINITLIDKNPYHTLMTELHEVAGSRVDPESVQVSYEKIFGGKQVNVIHDTVTDIDFNANKLLSETDEYPYDYLVLGVGAEPEYYGIAGVKEHSFKLWSLDDALKLRRHINDQFRHAAGERDSKKRKKMLTFAVAGAGFTGIEMAGEIIEHKQTLCRQYHIDEDDVRIIVIEAMEEILPILPEKLRKKAAKYLEKKGAEILLQSPITEAGKDYVEIKGENKIPTETLIWTAGVMGCEFAGNLSLTKGKCSNKKCPHATKFGTCGKPACEFAKGHRYVDGKRGRLLANEYLQSVDRENVYIVGDVLWLMEKRMVVPQIVETALQTAETAANNIIADIENKEKEKFESNYHGFMVSLGGKYGVAHVAGISLTGIFAMASKHLINLHYLFGLAGINAVWNYIKHEFLTIKNKRSFVGGQLSANIKMHWVLPLRLFVGAKWLIEGISKILDGWLKKGNVYIIQTAAASSASPAEGAAEQSWETVQPLIENPTGIYLWIERTFLQHIPMFFQSVVVLAEIGIGLALIGGLFTFLASGASIVLGIMFILSAMAGQEILWYIAAAIVLLGGAGKGFGLDHWVMPAIKKWWNGTRFAKRTYLYVDEPTDRKKKRRKS